MSLVLFFVLKEGDVLWSVTLTQSSCPLGLGIFHLCGLSLFWGAILFSTAFPLRKK